MMSSSLQAWCRAATAVVTAALMPIAVVHAAADLHLRVEAGNHTAAVRRIAVSPDETLIATVSDDKTGRIWRAADRRHLTTLRLPIGDADVGRLYGVAFSGDGEEVAVGGTNGAPGAPHRIDIFDSINGAHKRTLALDAGNIVRLLWTKKSGHLVACLAGGNGIRIVPAAGGSSYSDTFNEPCFGLAELPDGSILAASFDATIRHYRFEAGAWKVTRRIRTEIADPQSIAVSPDGQHFVVGYRSRLNDQRVAVDVFETAGGTLVRRFAFSDLSGGSLGSVAWSRDGQTIAASGRASAGDGYRLQMLVKRIAWPQGSVSTDFVATDTILDAAAIGPDQFAIASSNGSWAVMPAKGPIAPLGASVIDLRGPDNLKIADDARTVSFGTGGWSGATQFSLRSRVLQPGEAVGLNGPPRSRFGLSVDRWENNFRPSIAGRALAMEPLEISRSMAALPDDAGVILGTTRTLRRIDKQGQPQWSVRAAAEVTAVNVSRDGRVVVSAQADGTLQWSRSSDGQPLLTLFSTTDGRWVLWTPQGYYDAAPGAESLVGWHVNRPDGKGANFFSIGKFRDKYHRPDVIDRVLDTLDPTLALKGADQERAVRLAALQPVDEPPAVTTASVATTASVVTTTSVVETPSVGKAPPVVEAPSGVDPVAKRLPPVVSVYTPRSLQSESRTLRVEFSISATQQLVESMIVRVDGRPMDLAALLMPARQDGQAVGHLTVNMPERNAEVVVMGLAAESSSEPVYLSWNWRAPAVAAPPPVAAAQPRVPVQPSGPLPAGPLLAGPLPAGPLPAGISMAAPEPTPKTEPPPSLAKAAPATPFIKSRLFMVAIGVSEYARKEYSLDLAAKDATDFSGLMDGQVGKLYASVEKRLLTNQTATRAAVLEAIEWLRQSTGADDTGMLFIAGHGVNDASGRYFFLPHDADVRRLAKTSIGENELRKALSGLRGKAMLFVDTCHSGNVLGSGVAVNNEVGRLANTLASAENGVIVFSASTGRQESIENKSWGNGAFTKALIAGLKGAADFRNDGVVTHQGLSYFLGREVKTLTGGRQTPVTAVPMGMIDFPLVASASRL